MTAGEPSHWPPHSAEPRRWRQETRGGTKDDRMLREITVSMPPMIADLDVLVDADLSAGIEASMLEITRLDMAYGTDLNALSVLLTRTESVASSKIEAVGAGLDDYARALHGSRANPSASSMVAATRALHRMVTDVTTMGRIELATILRAHHDLMQDDSAESNYAGRLRDVQNWIGGSDHSPRNALFVPPPPDTVQAYIDDLIRFAERDDLSALVQAAIVHAQFESIHPFTDGNGRIGRALINAVLRRRGATSRVVIPLASALVADRRRYFGDLDSYRAGDFRPLITSFASGARSAAAEARVTADRLRNLPEEWRRSIGPTRSGSALTKLIEALPAHPILTAEDAIALTRGSRSSTFTAVDRLHEAGILRPLDSRRRDRVWGAGAVLDELEDLGARIEAASR